MGRRVIGGFPRRGPEDWVLYILLAVQGGGKNGTSHLRAKNQVQRGTKKKKDVKGRQPEKIQERERFERNRGRKKKVH